MKIFRSLFFVFLVLSFLFIAHRPAQAKDQWVQVKSKNFFLIGNASEKDIRRVGTRLEQFRETFRLLFSGIKLTASIPTNVVVFKNNGAYKEFKPKRADGKIDNEIAGYFQPGEDVNYITLAADGSEQETFGTIFHEYVHFIIDTNFGKSEVPPWFNEGLAEYYQTFEIADDIKVKLGLPQAGHLALLQQSRLMPLDDLFNVTSYQLHQTGGHSRSIFYAESWALIHYLIQNGKSDALDQFLKFVTSGVEPRKAFQDAFQTDYPKMENDLRRYVSKNSYNYNEIKFKLKLTFDAAMQASPLDETATNAYLGDLLYHTNRLEDAEPYLAAAVKLDPTHSMANTALGMVKLKQRKYDEARTYLEKAIAADHQSHNAYYRYAFLLSREGRDEFGFVKRFEAETAAKMRDALKKAIAINPAFAESYELLAFVALVNNEELDDALLQLQTALKYQPANQRYLLRMAEIYVRQNKLAEAHAIAEKIGRTSDDPETRNRAENLLSQVAQMKQIEELKAAEKKRYEAAVARTGSGPTRLVRRIEGVPRPSEAEIAKQQDEARMRSLNEALRAQAAGEQRVLGRITKIDCRKRPLVFTVKTATGTLAVTTRDFESISLNSLDPAATNAQVGCESDLSAFTAMVTYVASANPKAATAGQLVALEFLPADFRLMTAEEMNAATLVIYDETEASGQRSGTGVAIIPNAAELDAQRREAMMKAIKDALRKPADGEKRDIGYLDKIECSGKNTIFHLRTPARTFKMVGAPPQTLKIVVFVPDLGGVQFGCGIPPIEYPVVFIYNEKLDLKVKAAGEVVSLEFVPKTFVLDQ